MSTTRFLYRIEHRDTDGTLKQRIEDIVEDIDFEYNRIGGDGEFQMKVKKTFNNTTIIFDVDDDIRVYVKRVGDSDYQLWYRGFVESYEPHFEDAQYWEVNGSGYINQLDRIVLDVEYGSSELSAIVKDILDNYFIGEDGIDVTYSASDIENVGFIMQSAIFDDKVSDAIKKLADIAGKREWGVNSSAQFFFKERVNTIRHTLFLGAEISSYQRLDDYHNIINRVEVRGGRLEDGTIFKHTVDNTQSQADFGLRARKFDNSSIEEEIDAEKYGQSILQDLANISRKAKVLLPSSIVWFHETKPLGMIQVSDYDQSLNRSIYAVPMYNTVKYAGVDTYQINSVRYSLSKGRSGFDIRLDLGDERPELFTPIARLDYQLEQVRSR